MSLKISKCGKLPRLDVIFSKDYLMQHQRKHLMWLHSRALASERAHESERTFMMRDNITGKFVQETHKHQNRIDIIYEAIVHNQTYRQIARRLNVPFSTVRLYIQEYRRTGRTNKLMTQTARVRALEQRNNYYQELVPQRKAIIQQRRDQYRTGCMRHKGSTDVKSRCQESFLRNTKVKLIS